MNQATLIQVGLKEIRRMMEEVIEEKLSERKESLREYPERMSIAQAAKALGVSRRTLYNWGKAGKIEIGRYPSGRPYVDKEEIRRV